MIRNIIMIAFSACALAACKGPKNAKAGDKDSKKDKTVKTEEKEEVLEETRTDTAYKNSVNYHFNEPVTVALPAELDEISGISYYPKDDAVFAIIDEAGILYKVPLKNARDLKQWEFGGKKDYEDLVVKDSVFYILVSNGSVDEVRFDKNGKLSLQEFKSDFGSKKANEFETLYWDNNSSDLKLICKNCADDNNSTASAYSYDPKTHSYSPAFKIDVKEINQVLNENKTKLRASAAAINPVDNKLYVVSSISKLVAVYNGDKLENVYPLDPKKYVQPEGIAFAPNGDLYISSEKGNSANAAIMILARH